MGLVRKQSESIQSWSPHEDVWQVALRKNAKSGSSMWQLCIGGDGPELELNCLPPLDKCSDEGGQYLCEW